ncbi:ATP-dependent DNA helicase RecG [Macrococcoides caseolyticum]|uniref:ATP-dependent DNA helicase RecG n=1 Tax=Macrococcoides caseolyticum TaxID=69966 RepID=UPI001F38D409|nr:ATP-dependent DNA helicase RecG [Macrococcus caseolyticus]MCE4956784.1 ATP-dependent DNA helicase RecG [Macrococcus caseolyticus]
MEQQLIKRQSIEQLKGVGPKTLENLHALNIMDTEDLLLFLPYKYNDETIINIHDATDGEKITVAGEIYSQATVAHFGRNKSKVSFHMMVDNVAIRVEYFNQLYIKPQVVVGAHVKITGKWIRGKQIIQGTGFKKLEQVGDSEALVPQYSLKGRIKRASFQKLVRHALMVSELPPFLPLYLQQKYKLWDLKEAVAELHFPSSHAHLAQAKRTFAFCELLLFQLKMRSLHLKEHQSQHSDIPYNIEEVKKFISTLPFELTDAQKQVVNEIFRDLLSPMRMNRLLQGDVGSGKTVVAAIAMYALKSCGMQSALMVPTEILAEQHAESLSQLYGEAVNIQLLTSSIKGKKRASILSQLASGDIDILVGTHALISDPVEFKQLGLVITDEQHRFGVNQRKLLREKGQHANVLYMTATPIPRTLAISVFGQLDVSTIKQMPKGRQPIITEWTKHEAIKTVYQKTKAEIEKGRQAYVICPLIEESEHLDVKNATEIYETYQQIFGPSRVGLLHGKMKADEKERIMQQFASHQLDILVSTTVVEVGVNVPNATMMIIYDADRFGLSTLHQLRGRVGRGNNQSYCILVGNPETETGIERLQIMTQTTDGFILSEKDLQMRGPGDFFGVKQSGLPDFKVANIVEDYRMLEVARDEASELILSGKINDLELSHLKERLTAEINAQEID